MSETLKRIIAGFSIGGIVILLLNFLYFLYAIPALLFIYLFAFLGLEEYYRLVDRGVSGRPIKFLGHFFGFLILISYYAQFLYESKEHLEFPPVFLDFLETYQNIKNPVIPILVIFVIVTKTYSMMFRPIEGNTYNVMSTITGVLYVFLPLSIVLPMLSLDEGIFIFVFVAFSTIMTDVGGYFGGRWFGKHNAGLKVSPRKTWEGYIAGVLFANLFNLGFLYVWIKVLSNLSSKSLLILPSYWEASILTLVFSFATIFGDLVESAIKRDAKAKDSSTIIPGHGGVLDLVDAMLFTFPLGYFYFYIKTLFVL
ncbi:MAG: phosphatidate cytidylyltransferase [Leptospiraceae bacterium]|nr:phosphatidate cytidylyltransferase [Leptospiraceae bacterium]MDW7976692.1 CDP-archaeol synthase [Leptospiraceae bacterium]